MKIKNDLINIKIGKKVYEFKNLILNEYLRKLVSSQLDVSLVEDTTQRPRLECLLLKFDEDLEDISEDSELTSYDFDIAIDIGGYTYNINQTISEQKTEIQYSYTDLEKIRCLSMSGTSEEKYWLSNYIGSKITALGFCNSLSGIVQEMAVCAVLDTSNYSIYLAENQKFSIIRKDIITTDSIFHTTSSNIAGPLHLAPYGDDGRYGILYSLGLSSYTDSIDKEYVIGEDIEVVNNGTELVFEGIEEYLQEEPLLYCNSELQPHSSLYPIKGNYKYIILKYKVYDYTTDTGEYYYQAIPIDKFGKMNYKIKYERG